MIVSRSAPPGTAKVVPAASNIDDFDDLRQFAQDMALAEGFGDSLCCSWGCVALLQRNRQDLVDNWRIQGFATSRVLSPYAPNDAPIDATGIVEPALWNPALDTFEAVLVTVTTPASSLPSGEEIADAMGHAPAGNKAHQYFRNNVDAGITTFQDAEILAALADRGFGARTSAS